MTEAITQALLSNMDRVSESIGMNQDTSFSNEESRQSKLFKAANAMLFKNQKISASALIGSTTMWLFFEWVNAHLISLICYGLIFWMVVQYFWRNTTTALMGAPSQVPRIVLSEEVFASMGRAIGSEVNSKLTYLQDVSCGGNKRQFLMVMGSLLTAGTIASWCNFLTMVYMGFVAVHTAPVIYTNYEDQINVIVSSVLETCQKNCNNLGGKVQLNKRSSDKDH